MAISQTTVVMGDGSVKIQLTVPFLVAPPPNINCGTTAPAMANISASQSSTGGTLAGGHNYFYGLVAIDASGNLSFPSDLLEVVVPSGTNTNEVTLAGVTPFDDQASQYQLYRATDNPSLPLLISGPTSVPGGSSFTFTDTGLSTSNVLFPCPSLAVMRLYWRITGTQIWLLAGETRDGSQTSIAFDMPLNVAGQSIDLQLRSVDTSGTETPEPLAPTETYVVTAAYPTALSIAGAPSSNPVSITAGGSIPPTLPQGIFTYTSTTTSIDISWASFSILRPDGNTTSVGSGGQNVTGLSASTTYMFYPYYNEFSAAIEFATGGSGSPAIAFTSNNATAAQTQNLQGNMPLSNGPITAATPASGSGGGGTGGGGTRICVRRGMWIETRERGLALIETCEVGEHLSCKDGWTEILKKRVVPMNNFVRIVTRGGCAVQVTPTHEIIVADGPGIPAARLSLDRVLYVKGGYDSIRSIELLNEPSDKVSLSCEPHHMFYAGEAGPDILVHNVQPIS